MALPTRCVAVLRFGHAPGNFVVSSGGREAAVNRIQGAANAALREGLTEKPSAATATRLDM
ncbi:MAG: hypothetical protein ACKVPX_07115 [Myxococcaceae bacterium]